MKHGKSLGEFFAAIDLVDGDQFVAMLKSLGLGVTTRQVEEVSVDRAWFEGI